MKRTSKFKPLLCAAAVLPAGNAHAVFSLLENFDGLTAGALGTQGGWNSDAEYSVVNDPAGGTNQVLEFTGAGQSGAYLALGGAGVAEGASGTLFGRFRFIDTGNANLGLSEAAAPAAYNDFKVQINRQNGTPIKARDAGGFQDLSTPLADNADTWYNIWAVADNATDTSRIYIQSDTDPDFATQTEVFTPDGTINFRSDTTDALSTLMLRSQEGTAYFDDFYISPGTDLSNPTIPEPSSLALLLLGGAAFARRKRS